MLDWGKFQRISGDHQNAHAFSFESLCRGVVTRHFRQHGSIKELKNQPGVEFHIELGFDDPKLGFKGQHVGWQCKWFQYRQDGGLTAEAKEQIKKSLQKTKEHLPDINIWILWTHKTLSKSDQQWFYGLKGTYEFDLQLWNGNDLDSFLVGPAIDLRATYFEELALSPTMLNEQHRHSVAPIKKRWLHETHQTTSTERDIRRILGEPSAWSSFHAARAELIDYTNKIIELAKSDEYKHLARDIEEFICFCQQVIANCEIFGSSISGRDIKNIEAIATSIKQTTTVYQLLRILRRQNLPLSLLVTNANAAIKDIKRLLNKACVLFSQQVLAVIGRAGSGKTQLSAELTSSSSNRIAGVLLLGRELRKGGALDSIVQRISFDRQKVDTFEMLVSALDSAGERNKCRVPIVIDGLNEAEDPREWKGLLASTKTTLEKYPNVVLICTLRIGEGARKSYGVLRKKKLTRESFAEQALPEDCYDLALESFDENVTLNAINAYFRYYKIKADPLTAPISFFSHPLNLKIFCEVTNRSREHEVSVTSFPSSIYGLFREQVAHSSTTISEMINLSVRYSFTDVEDAVYYFGEALWNANRRSIPEDKFLEKIRTDFPDWESNIINLLSQEGLLFRDLVNRGSYCLTPAYDRFGGYVIAFYLMEAHTTNGDISWLTEPEFTRKIFGELSQQHELAEDILHALVALAPKYNLPHIWQSIPEQYKHQVLKLSHLIDPCHICDKTTEEFKRVILKEGLSRQIIETLGDVRFSVSHPFNASFFSEVLFQLPLADRDLSWGEYFRRDYEGLIDDIRARAQIWRDGDFADGELEKLRALLIVWFLSSNVCELRDVSTQALVNYGISNTDSFLDIAQSFFSVNDSYILERVMAASYAVICMSLDNSRGYEKIEEFTKRLINEFFAKNATCATTHIVLRGYASCLVARVALEPNMQISESQLQSATVPFVSMPRHDWQEIQVDGMSGRSSPLHMDFENYTIGRLVRERSNYDFEHPEYAEVRNKILWRTIELGWSEERFGEVDNRISSHNYYGRFETKKVERYGKKYAWIAYYEMAGILQDSYRLKYWGYRFEAGIDPFFPQIDEPLHFNRPYFLGSSSDSTENWIIVSDTPKLSELSKSETLDEDEWTLVSAFIVEESKELDRHFYSTVSSYLVSTSALDELREFIVRPNELDFPDEISVRDVYLGEVYTTWSCEPEEKVIRALVGSKRKKVDSLVAFEDGADTTQFIDIPTYREFQIEHLIVEYNWKSNGENVSIPLLSPWVVQMLNLSFDMNKLCYFDQVGVQVSSLVFEKKDGYSNNRKRFYLRTELVDRLLSMSSFELITRVHGERRVANVGYHGKHRYKDFEEITLSSQVAVSSNG
ncbi:TPA: ATP-binding protein [Vibrio parahaemolyticus]|nr:ATP-binding protein [Vibrio parahaemolyticus]